MRREGHKADEREPSRLQGTRQNRYQNHDGRPRHEQAPVARWPLGILESIVRREGLLRRLSKSDHKRFLRTERYSDGRPDRPGAAANSFAAPLFLMWCGEGDLFSCTALIARKLYTSRRRQVSESSTRTRLSHTASHTAPPLPPRCAYGG